MLLSAGAAPTSLDLSFQDLRSDKGVLRICMTADPKNFPDCVNDKAAITRSIRATERTVHFGGIAAGNYAVAVIHDENANAKLDTFAGIPKEGIGFSRNPVFTFGPPRFTAARFALGDQPVTQSVRMKYFL